MKSKKTLKQKIALSLIATSGALAIGGTILFGVGSVQKNNKVKEFTNSAEYKQTITDELVAAEQKYEASEPTLDSLKEYYDTTANIYSFEHAKDILKNSTSEAGKEYDSKTKLQIAGAVTFFVGLGAVTATSMLAFPANKKEESENTPVKE